MIAGGIVGETENGVVIENCYVTQQVDGSKLSGAFIGKAVNGGTVLHCIQPDDGSEKEPLSAFTAQKWISDPSIASVNINDKVNSSSVHLTFLKQPKTDYAAKADLESATSMVALLLKNFISDSKNFDTIRYDQDTIVLTDHEKMICYTKKHGTVTDMTYTCKLANNADLIYDEAARTLQYVYRSEGKDAYTCTVTLTGNSGSLICRDDTGDLFSADVFFYGKDCSLSNYVFLGNNRDLSSVLGAKLTYDTLEMVLGAPISSLNNKIEADGDLTQYLYFGLPDKK
ncbi:MAG: hypothetical protein IJK02_09015 [Clostridia bacterium]|nr:hypothetical protein [Clostridia bacterium]